MTFKYIIESVVVILIAMLIFSYFFNPLVKYQTNAYISNIKNTLKSNVESGIEKIPTPEKKDCISRAKELVPKYFLFSDVGMTQGKHYWNDGLEIEELPNKDHAGYADVGARSCFKAGTNSGENINYFYPISEEDKNELFHPMLSKCPSSLSYSKKIISPEGVVLGYDSFVVNQIVFKLREKQIETNEGEYDGKTDTYSFKWSGFDDEMKKLFAVDKIKFEIILEKSPNPITICEKESSQEKGEFICEGLAQSGWSGGFHKGAWGDKFDIEPDIYDNKVYELISYNIESCNWIEE